MRLAVEFAWNSFSITLANPYLGSGFRSGKNTGRSWEENFANWDMFKGGHLSHVIVIFCSFCFSEDRAFLENLQFKTGNNNYRKE